MQKEKTILNRRAFKREAVDLRAIIVFGNMFHTGKIVNLSENGVLIRTKLCPPVDSSFSIMVCRDRNLSQANAVVKRTTMSNGNPSGIGAEIMNNSWIVKPHEK